MNTEQTRKIFLRRDLKLVLEWIRADKLSLNTSMVELVIIKSRDKTITKHLNFHISGQKIQPTPQVKNLGVTLTRKFTLSNKFGKSNEETNSYYWSTLQDQTLCTRASFANIILFIV